jgi:serine protease AprX
MTEDRNVMTMDISSDLGEYLGSSSYTKKFAIDNHISSQTGADILHDMGITGNKITVAVLDSGSLMGGEKGRPLLKDSDGKSRSFSKYDAQLGIKTKLNDDDENGHGTHVTGIISSSLQSENGQFNGIAPDVNILSVKAFDENGSGSYTDVLDGLNYIYQKRRKYKIRVVNLSLGAKVQSTYWNDPINQAVMRLWEAGVVVVTSAGNSGSDYGTVTVPGNNPYVITVGAITDNYSVADSTDDRITTFSSRGPTYEGFVKPEVVAYGGHIRSKMDISLLINQNFVADDLGADYSRISGTSQAAAMVTGTVALMLQNDKNLTPDDVKCRLMDSAVKMSNPVTGTTYDPLTQGAGLINAYEAVMSQASGCANVGLDIEADLNGEEHYKGPTIVTEDGRLGIRLTNGDVLTEGFDWGGSNLQGFDWGNAYAEGFDWGDADAQGFDWGNAQGLGFDWDSIDIASFSWEIDVLGFDWGSLGVEGFDWDISIEGFDWGRTAAESADWGTTAEESVVGSIIDPGSPEVIDEILQSDSGG